MMKLNFIHLCDHAFQSEGGKFNIIGIFKNINVRNFPGGVPKFNLVCSFEVPATASGEFTMNAKLVGPKGKHMDVKIPQIKGAFPKQKRNGHFDMTFNLEVVGYKFPEPGKYKFIVQFNEKDAGNISFSVLQYPKGSN